MSVQRFRPFAALFPRSRSKWVSEKMQGFFRRRRRKTSSGRAYYMKADIVNPAAAANQQYSRWDEQVAIHRMIQSAFAPGAASVNFGHGGLGRFSFLSWHRYFLHRLELALQSVRAWRDDALLGLDRPSIRHDRRFPRPERHGRHRSAQRVFRRGCARNRYQSDACSGVVARQPYRMEAAGVRRVRNLWRRPAAQPLRRRIAAHLFRPAGSA